MSCCGCACAVRLRMHALVTTLLPLHAVPVCMDDVLHSSLLLLDV